MLLPWHADEILQPPLHEVHAHHPRHPIRSLEILLNDAQDGRWQYRRHPAITRPLDAVGLRSPEGIPFLAPEIVLLYKARNPRARDLADFQAVLPGMQPEQREWLRNALKTAHPRSPWLAALNGATS
ncbi:MAG: hypothetical protein Kow0077_12110 [Anaerolineae bacterium]